MINEPRNNGFSLTEVLLAVAILARRWSLEAEHRRLLAEAAIRLENLSHAIITSIPDEDRLPRLLAHHLPTMFPPGNLVVWRWRELRTTVNIGSCTAPETFRFGSNWWYCEDRPSQSRPELPVPDYNGIVGRDPRLAVDGLTIIAEAAPGHGAHAPRAAAEFANFGPKLAPWAYRKHRETE